MRAVIQRVKEASVKVDSEIISSIDSGLLLLLGIDEDDTEKEASFIAEKIVNLRVFEDDKGKMNFSVKDLDGEILVVSQFTLYGDCKKGRRPSFSNAARPNKARDLYYKVIEEIQSYGIRTQTGSFGSFMEVTLINDGPVTLILDTQDLNRD